MSSGFQRGHASTCFSHLRAQVRDAHDILKLSVTCSSEEVSDSRYREASGMEWNRLPNPRTPKGRESCLS
jgi:hypothetical protein